MIEFVIVGAGGFCGAIARYGLSQLVTVVGSSGPLGTLLANVLGCLLFGVLIGLSEHLLPLPPRGRLFLLVGFVGSFTTLSAVTAETLSLFGGGRLLLAALHLGQNVLLSLLGMTAGEILVRAIARS